MWTGGNSPNTETYARLWWLQEGVGVQTHPCKNVIIRLGRQLGKWLFESEIIQHYTKGMYYAAALRMEMQSFTDPSAQTNALCGRRLLKGTSQNTSAEVKTLFSVNCTQLRNSHTFVFACVLLWLICIQMFHYVCCKQMEILIKAKGVRFRENESSKKCVCQKPIKTLSSTGS